MTATDRFPVGIWRAVLAAGIAAHLVLALTGDPVWAQRLMAALCVLAALGAGARAIAGRRALWSMLAVGIGTWAVGDIYFTVAVSGHADAEFPSVADVLWIVSYLPLYAAIVLVIRGSVTGVDVSLWIDGMLAALTAAAVGAALVLPAIDTGNVDTLVVVTTLAYPITDLVLLAGVAGGWVLSGGASAGTWRWLGAGLVILAVTDIVFVLRVADGTYQAGGWTDAGWPLAWGLIASACWTGVADRPERRVSRRRLPLVPLVCSLVALVLLLLGQAFDLGLAVAVLAAITLVLSWVRTARAFLTVARLQDTAVQAVTDELTGLGNRRHLLRDLDRVVSRSPAPATLALFDLDGFKSYNDAYGHPAGDALLAALGQRLEDAVGSQGDAYRLGGDEFCIVIGAHAVDHDLVLDRAVDALREEGQGFSIGASYGAVRVTEETTSGAQALQLADTRMYAQKDARRGSTRRQSRDLLLQLLHEQQPDLEEHSGDVGELVVAVGRRMGLGEEALDHARHAAELHDVGKVAIPASILNKAGPLDDDEWALMKRHTVIGERILSAVPALVPVGRVVRSTHERWDGGGYPDALRTDEIPLGARIIAVCDSFHAITTDRAYRAGRSQEEALTELRRCAGTQFDPDVVEAFATELEAEGTCPDAVADEEPAGGAIARRVLPAGAIAQSAAGELAHLAKLRGLLHATQLARGGAEVTDVLHSVARTIASSLGFRVVSINLYRPEWDDFITAAVEGEEAVRMKLLGTVEPAEGWRPLLDERFLRGGAYFVPAGAVDDEHDEATCHVPDIAPTDDPGAWQADDLLLVPLLGRNGEVLGLVSVDEPVWGRRPTDAEVEVLVAVADHAALAVQSARSTSIARRAREAGDRAALLGGELAATVAPGEVAAAVARCAREALGYGSVAVEVVRSPEDAAALEDLLARDDTEGCSLLGGEDARLARLWRGMGSSTRNGRGDRAWNDHLLAVPVRGADCELLAVIWLDEPEDRLLPHPSTLRVLRTIAAQAVVAFAWGRRVPAPAGGR